VRGFFEARFWRQYRCIKAALPLLAPDGSVVLMSGFLLPQAGVRILAVRRRQRAIEATVKVLAIEAAPIRVNALVAGQIDTRSGGGPMDEAAHRADRESVARQLPLGRIGTAGEVAHAALFLAENTFTTGITLDIDVVSADGRPGDGRCPRCGRTT
jgi:NAD(P)-dependent dehydrogenase (short-subunit alcohol dehydrogenase family)